jgi:hypothetical protein
MQILHHTTTNFPDRTDPEKHGLLISKYLRLERKQPEGSPVF